MDRGRLGASGLPATVRFRFASWNVNNRTLTRAHLDRLREARPDIIALQEASAEFHAALVAADRFAWAASSQTLRPAQAGEGRARRLGCSLFGTRRFACVDTALVPGLRFPERTLVATLQAPGHRFRACAFHIPPGASWGRVKPQTVKSIAEWLATQPAPLVFGIDANTPKVDHPDIARNQWWWADEPLLLGPAPRHGLRDALRDYLDAHPAVRARVVAERPDGPLAVSHVRGNLRRRTLLSLRPHLRKPGHPSAPRKLPLRRGDPGGQRPCPRRRGSGGGVSRLTSTCQSGVHRPRAHGETLPTRP
jgi:hypothetical protein